MKKLLLSGLVCARAAVADETYFHMRMGDFDYWAGPNGQEATGQQIGNFYYLDGSYLDCNAERHHFSGTGYRVGDFDYFDFRR